MTLAETAYDALRHDIVRGVLAPGKPLRMAQLSERYGMGFSPLREALNRLQAERLVTSIALRGFSVAPLSMAEMWDTINTRVLIEQRALRLAMAQGGDDWETGIVSALHSLTLQSTRAAEGGADEQKLLEDRHHGFHLALIAGCGSSWLLEFFQRLYARPSAIAIRCCNSAMSSITAIFRPNMRRCRRPLWREMSIWPAICWPNITCAPRGLSRRR